MLGLQRPKYCSVPAYSGSSGDDAIELCRIARLPLSPWQEFVLRESLGERDDGKWAAKSVGLCVPRQNGKSQIIIARQLVGLFLLREPLQIYTAHLFPAALEIFRRLVGVIEDTPELLELVKLSNGKVGREGNGKEGIELKTGERILYKARSKSSGRGYTCDCLYLDEAMILSEMFMAGAVPSQSAIANMQRWYCGSAVDETVHEDGVVFARLRERGLTESDKTLAWFEWSVDRDEYYKDPSVAKDPAYWGQANPALDYQLDHEIVADECEALSEESFIVERLGVGNWPRTDGKVDSVIDPEDWKACLDPRAQIEGRVVFAVDTNPTRTRGSLVVAGRADGLVTVEVIEAAEGVTWLPEAVSKALAKRPGSKVMACSFGGVASLLSEFRALGITVTEVNSTENRTACGAFYDLISDHALRHRGDGDLDAALDGALKTEGDTWSWSKRSSRTDITPLVAATLAAWGLKTNDQATYREIAIDPEPDTPAATITNPFYSVIPMASGTVS